MNTRLIVRSSLGAITLLVLCTSLAMAGGWAVITLDELPTEIAAGQALSIGFTVRQHGQTLRSDLEPIVRFERAAAKEAFQVTAQRQGADGHYVAVVTFPSGGQWNWTVDIEQFGMITQPMPELMVKATSTKPQPASLTRVFDLISMIRQALTGKAAAATASAKLVAADTAPVDQVALGKALFSAKGCVMCHTHDDVKTQFGPFGFGEVESPNLSERKYSDDYLRLWLKSPQDVKPQTRMPQLQLKEKEIEALIAFLQSK